MENLGWIKLHRRITEHWIWENPKELKWWFTILLHVNHEPTKVSVSDGLYDVQAGESFISIERWATLFGCAKKTVLKFFFNLERDDMIERKILGKGNRRKHLLSVRNWEKYQIRKPETTPKRNPNVPPNKNDNNENNNNTDQFEIFWNHYHKITGKLKTDKEAALKYWKKLTKAEQAKAIEKIQAYSDSEPDKKFCKIARTYLSGKSFNNQFENTAPQAITVNEQEYDD